jgi:hypothetical protein
MSNINDVYGDPKERMLKHIAMLWGTKNIDALDPLVRIMIEALAGELRKTYNSIQSFEKRMLERFALLMTPGVLSTPYCAHAIAQAFPVEATEIIRSLDQFFYAKKMNKDQKIQQMHFSPIADVRIFDVAIKHLVIGNTAWALDDQQLKATYTNMLHLAPQSDSIWLGIRVNSEIETLKGLSFFFEQINATSNYQIRQLLSSSEWHIGDKKINMRLGRIYEESEELPTVFSEMETMNIIEKEISHLYDSNFISIADDAICMKDISKEKYPEAFKLLFLDQDLKEFNQDLVWIKITSDYFVHHKNLSDIQISLNVFPVLNRRCVNQIYRFKNNSNNIPLRTMENEFFLSIITVEDDFARKYKEIALVENTDWTDQNYTVRKGGMERMDARDAKEYLEFIIELMRDESATFASFGHDSIANSLKELNQLTEQLNQRVARKKDYVDTSSYLILGDPKNNQSYFIDYWTTNSIHANGIPAGSVLATYTGSKFVSGSISLRTTTLGGKLPLNPARHIDAYKYATLSHNKIITVEDIKACCLHELGDKIERHVEVRKGLMVSPDPKQGLIRCVEVILTKKIHTDLTADTVDWDIELASLQSKIELRSALNLTIYVHLS